jgi:hypothetical protein
MGAKLRDVLKVPSRRPMSTKNLDEECSVFDTSLARPCYTADGRKVSAGTMASRGDNASASGAQGDRRHEIDSRLTVNARHPLDV